MPKKSVDPYIPAAGNVDLVDVFLSYSRRDRAIADTVKALLEELGLTVFMDTEYLDAGDTFPDVVDRQLRNAGAVLSLWSRHALTRPWVKIECRVGQDRGVLIPVSIEQLDPLKDIPVVFYDLQFVDLSIFDGDPAHPSWEKVVHSLARTLKKPELANFVLQKKIKERDAQSALREELESLRAELKELKQASALAVQEAVVEDVPEEIIDETVVESDHPVFEHEPIEQNELISSHEPSAPSNRPPVLIACFILLSLVAAMVLMRPSASDIEPEPVSIKPFSDINSDSGSVNPFLNSLPSISSFDKRVLMNPGEPKSGVGVAFAVDESGAWLTVRYNVEGCDSVKLKSANGDWKEVNSVSISEDYELALLFTDSAPGRLLLGNARDIKRDQSAAMVGFAGARPIEFTVNSPVRATLVTQGDYNTRTPIISWDYTGEVIGTAGSPILDQYGALVGVQAAVSERESRLHAIAEEPIKEWLEENEISLPLMLFIIPTVDTLNPKTAADELRRKGVIARLACEVN